ncbi:hypothetical protein OM075_23255 [Marinilabiliaceae bacterium AAT]|uniref:Uncharacterized protein n=1 Tax=Plebeiibacterium sediminum TaxID=2992112 RepID=A0AAE3MAF0_9BACT|nr:hypothetical protein [Plebeiobacterium sediminum]
MMLFTSNDYRGRELLEMDNIKLNELFTSYTTFDNYRFYQLIAYLDKVNRAINHLGFTFQYPYNVYKQ